MVAEATMLYGGGVLEPAKIIPKTQKLIGEIARLEREIGFERRR